METGTLRPGQYLQYCAESKRGIDERVETFSKRIYPKRIYPSAGYNFSRRPGTPPPIPTPTPVATPRISSLKISQNANITS